MITPAFLQSCTDEQINKGVAWLKSRRSQSYIYVHSCESWFKSVINYCEHPNEAWPIILSSRIGIKPRGVDSDWYAYQGKVEVINENPLRAAMEVYILMSIQS